MSRWPWLHAFRFLSAGVLLALSAALLAVAPVAVATAGAEECPAPVPVSELQDRLDAGEQITGTGYTVSRGGTPEPFDVEVLGIQGHWFLPGRHIIVVETDSPAIDRAKGIWFGMSGSPVHAEDGRLLGGLAWGFTRGPSKLAGLTPAQELLDLLDYPPGADVSATAELLATQSGSLSGALAREVQRRDPRAGTHIEPLQLPVPVGKPQAVNVAQDYFEEQGLPLLAVAGGGATGTGVPATPQPGGNFAAALSYGQNAYYASGTTTFACAGYAVAFAHWFFASGRTLMGANDGHAITIADDLFGPYKLMNLGGQLGTLDHDHFAGVRAALGVAPSTAGVHTALEDLDTGRFATGTTDVVYRPMLPFIAAMHLWDATDATIDRWGPGTASLGWTVTGTRADGGAWTLTRDNMFASHWDIGVESFWELWELLGILQFNDFETVTFDAVDIGGAFEETVRRSRLGPVLVSVDGGPFEPAEHGLVVRPGATLDLQVSLTDLPAVELSLQVPDDAGELVVLRVTGGGARDFEVFDGDGGPVPGQPETFDDLLAELEALPRNNEVVAELIVDVFWDGGDDDFSAASSADAPGLRDRALVDAVVLGESFTELFVEHDDHEVPELLRRIFGRDRLETAVAVSQHTYPEPDSVDSVVLARADDYADALAGAPLAAGADAPLLLTRRGALPTAVAEEIARLGASGAVLLGGPAAISEAVAEELAAQGLTVERVGGNDRYDTARLIAERVGGEQAYLALGNHPDPHRGWPDALAVSALAAAEQRPVLLTAPERLPVATAQALSDLGVSELTVVGGPAAVPEAIVDAARAADRAIERLAGRDRYETSLAIARRAVEAGAEGGRLWLATGRNFPDALAAGPAVAADGGVLLLIDGLQLDRSPAALDWLLELDTGLEHLTLLGGPAAIADDVEQELRAVLDA